jgi:hypothetical protein
VRGSAAALSLAVLAACACTRVVTVVTPAPTAWPVAGHSANSDPWLVDHNQVITSMSPAVLILNFDANESSTATEQYAAQVVTALGAGSIYHGYSNPTATPFLNYQIAKVVDLTSVPPPLTATSPLTIDVTALFTDTTFAPHYGYSDGASGYLSLCQLFEQGVINEVWIQDGGDAQTTPRAPLYAERKQVYDDEGHAITGAFESCLGGSTSCLNVSCGVTVRIAHLDPAPSGGPGCDLWVRGWGIDSMWSVLPSFATDANAFLNEDFNTRFGVSFTGWPEICGGNAPCIRYLSPTIATNAPSLSTTFTFDPFLQGCGNSLYPSNGTSSGDFENSYAVESRCEHFGLRDGAKGQDTYLPYSSSVVSALDQTYTGNSQCPAGWQVYWRQSMPGYQNHATATDGAPMKNWWPILFY